MTMRRKFEGEPINRLIVSVPLSMVEQIDSLTRCTLPTFRERTKPNVATHRATW